VDATGRGVDVSTCSCPGGTTSSGETRLMCATGDAGVSTAVGLRIITGLFSLLAVAVVGVSVSRERWRESSAVKGSLSARVGCPQSQALLVSATPISTPTAIPRTG
jgi:hypothetical protein